MIKIVKATFVITFLLLSLNRAKAQTYQWAKSIGSINDDHGQSIAVDGSGNVYITGYFGGTADFDPGAGTANLTSNGSGDIFFSKYDSSGNYLWAKSIGSINSDYGLSISTDIPGNLYITGWFQGTADFDPDSSGTAILTSNNSSDIFFAKYDSSGNYLWAKSIGSTFNDVGYDIAVDSLGIVYITGYFEGIADFDPGAGTESLSSDGGKDIFFAKYDSSGNYLWAKNIGSTGNDIGYSIAVDNTGCLYITGYFEGIAGFDPGAGTANLTSNGSGDVFFAKYDSSGNYLWAKNIGSANDDRCQSIVVDGSSAYITGYFGGTADFDPGAGTANLTSNSIHDIFFAKYDPSGDYLWAKKIGGIDDDRGSSIVITGSGNVYITGGFGGGTVDFDPGIGTAYLFSNGTQDIFFAKYDSSGNYLWAKSIGSISEDFGISIAADDLDNVYITGYFYETADFDAGTGTANLTSNGSCDIFFAKYSGDIVAVPDIALSGKLLIYPNPSNGKFIIKLQGEHQEMNVEIYNAFGENILRKTTSNEIDLSAAPKGIYFVKIYNGVKIQTEKIVIQ